MSHSHGGIPLDSTNSAKRALRAHLRRERELHFAPESWSHILHSREIQAAHIVASYISYGVEPQTQDINSALIGAGKTLLLPKTLDDNDIEWVIWGGSQDSLRKNGRVLEPIGAAFLDLNSIEVVIVPALQIDSTGNRMGQGGGSYDRALPRLSGWKVGLVGATELAVEPLPVENHDQRMNAAATPSLLMRFTPGAAVHL